MEQVKKTLCFVIISTTINVFKKPRLVEKYKISTDCKKLPLRVTSAYKRSTYYLILLKN